MIQWPCLYTQSWFLYSVTCLIMNFIGYSKWHDRISIVYPNGGELIWKSASNSSEIHLSTSYTVSPENAFCFTVDACVRVYYFSFLYFYFILFVCVCVTAHKNYHQQLLQTRIIQSLALASFSFTLICLNFLSFVVCCVRLKN